MEPDHLNIEFIIECIYICFFIKKLFYLHIIIIYIKFILKLYVNKIIFLIKKSKNK